MKNEALNYGKPCLHQFLISIFERAEFLSLTLQCVKVKENNPASLPFSSLLSPGP